MPVSIEYVPSVSKDAVEYTKSYSLDAVMVLSAIVIFKPYVGIKVSGASRNCFKANSQFIDSSKALRGNVNAKKGDTINIAITKQMNPLSK